MPSGTSLDLFQNAIPSRFYDVGIAEQHAVTFAAGLAAGGFKPVCAIYSTFLQRAYDQLIHDVALQNLHVVFAIDRAGLVGEDGPTHHGAFDLSFLHAVPNLVIMAPGDEQELRDMLYTALYEIRGPVAIRYPRGGGNGTKLNKEFTPIPVGKGRMLRNGDSVALLGIGTMASRATEVAALLEAQGLNPMVCDMRFLKPLDTEMIDTAASRCSCIAVMEENSVIGGLGSGVIEYLSRKHPGVRSISFGLPDAFVTHGSMAELYREIGLDAQTLSEKILDFYKDKP